MKNSGESANILMLDQVKLHVGDMMQLHIQSEQGDARYYVSLIGYLKGQSVIVTTPVADGKVMLIREGQSFVVRFFGGKNAYAFSAIAKRVTNVPFPHLHLSYPKEVRGMAVRHSSRARVNLIGSAVTKLGKRIACQVRDISMGGALLVAKEAMGELDEHLGLSLRVKVSGFEHILDLEAKIRSCHDEAQQADSATSLLHGVCFDNLTPQDGLVLTALLYNSQLGQADEL